METEVKVDFIQKISEYSKEVFRMHNDMEYLCEILNSLDIKLLREYYIQDKSGPIIDLRKEVIREIMLGSISPNRLEEIIQKYKSERSQEMKAWKNPYKILHAIINTKYYHVDVLVQEFINEVKSMLDFEVSSHFVNFDGANNMGADEYWLCFYPVGEDRSKSQIFLSIKNGDIKYGVYSHIDSKYHVGPFDWSDNNDFFKFVEENQEILENNNVSNYFTKIEFEYNGQKLVISGESRTKFYTNVIDWLSRSGYKFPENYHNTRWRKTYTKDEKESLIQSGSYNESNFHNVCGSGIFVMRCSGSVVKYVKGMFDIFGCKILEISTSENNNSESEAFTLTGAAKFALLENENKPMSSREVWDKIVELKLKLNVSGKTPQASLNTNMLYSSINSNTGHKVKNPIFKIVSTSPNKFVLINYVPKNIKESLIEDGFVHISKLKEILESMGYKPQEN